MASDGSDNGAPEPKPPWWDNLAPHFFKRGRDSRRNTRVDRPQDWKPSPGRPAAKPYLAALQSLEGPALQALARVLQRGTDAATVAAAREVLSRLHGREETEATTLRIIVGDTDEVLEMQGTRATLPETTEDDKGEET
jgi:hypothetical protein